MLQAELRPIVTVPFASANRRGPSLVRQTKAGVLAESGAASARCKLFESRVWARRVRRIQLHERAGALLDLELQRSYALVARGECPILFD